MMPGVSDQGKRFCKQNISIRYGKLETTLCPSCLCVLLLTETQTFSNNN